MEKIAEFNTENEILKKYLEESLSEKDIKYEIKLEERWTQNYIDVSKYYKVYCLYVNSDNINQAKQIIEDFEKAKIITDDIEELKNEEPENSEENLKNKIFTKKNFLKYYWGAILIIAILIIIGLKFTS